MCVVEEIDPDYFLLGQAFAQNVVVRELILFLTSCVWMCILLRSTMC